MGTMYNTKMFSGDKGFDFVDEEAGQVRLGGRK